MILDGLNPNQLQAVTTRSRSVLVLAGAGSGKTGTLTRRIAHLCQDQGVSPHNILALTFTRKAANEMKERLKGMLGEKESKKLWIGTFHAVSLRILQQYGYRIGYSAGITVYDEIDQKDIISAIISELGLSIKLEDVVAQMQGYASDCDRFEIEEEYTLVLTEYRNRLKEFNAVDFTLLLTEVLRLCREFPDVYRELNDKFRYVFVDEYQDVDRTQYYLHEALKPEHIFCVGDMNQTIYTWRGSDMKIILEFEKAHEGSEVIILDRSYRCAANILDAANNLISHNPKQYDITLWTDREGGLVRNLYCVDPKDEAKTIANSISNSAEDPKDFAILTRTHRQHEVITEALKYADIPFKVIGQETNFWKKSSSRYIVAMLKIIHNQKNVWHFNKICRHVIYPMTEAEWLGYESLALRRERSVLQLLAEEKQGPFAELLKWYKENPGASLLSAIEKTLEAIPIQEFFLMQSLTTKAMDVLEVTVHAQAWMKSNADNTTVPEFLSWLASQEIQAEIREDENVVKVSTIHAVKGLEFPVVFIAGMVEGKLPSNMAIMEGSTEEERRLAYVAVTRAKDRLYLSTYSQPGGYGSKVKPSRFLSEMNPALSELIGGPGNSGSPAEARKR